MNVGRNIRKSSIVMGVAALGIGTAWAVGGGCSPSTTTSGNVSGVNPNCPNDAGAAMTTPPPAGSAALVAQGEQTFRFDTFGDEVF